MDSSESSHHEGLGQALRWKFPLSRTIRQDLALLRRELRHNNGGEDTIDVTRIHCSARYNSRLGFAIARHPNERSRSGKDCANYCDGWAIVVRVCTRRYF